MSFQSRDLKLLVGLLMIVGLFSETHEVPTSNLCYGCDGRPDCDNPTKEDHTTMCSEQVMACFKTGVAGAMKRGCYSDLKARCIQRGLSDGTSAFLKPQCYNAIVHKHLTVKIKQCLVDYGLPTDLPTAVNGTFCVCTFATYCNEGPAELHDYGNGTTEAPGPGLKCYSCEDDATNCSTAKYCIEGEYCAEAMSSDGKVTKWCLSKRQAECMKGLRLMTISKDGYCWDSKYDQETTEEFWNKVEKCSSSPRARILGGQERSLNKVCICDDVDRCNDNLKSQFKPVPVGESSSNRSNHFIFSILTIATIYFQG